MQQLDEALTRLGHDPECGTFEVKPCSCTIGDTPETIRVVKAAADALGVAVDATPLERPAAAAPPGAVTLTGSAADAYRRFQTASRKLITAQAAAQDAAKEYRTALEAFSQASVEQP